MRTRRCAEAFLTLLAAYWIVSGVRQGDESEPNRDDDKDDFMVALKRALELDPYPGEKISADMGDKALVGEGFFVPKVPCGQKRTGAFADIVQRGSNPVGGGLSGAPTHISGKFLLKRVQWGEAERLQAVGAKLKQREASDEGTGGTFLCPICWYLRSPNFPGNMIVIMPALPPSSESVDEVNSYDLKGAGIDKSRAVFDYWNTKNQYEFIKKHPWGVAFPVAVVPLLQRLKADVSTLKDLTIIDYSVLAFLGKASNAEACEAWNETATWTWGSPVPAIDMMSCACMWVSMAIIDTTMSDQDTDGQVVAAVNLGNRADYAWKWLCAFDDHLEDDARPCGPEDVLFRREPLFYDQLPELLPKLPCPSDIFPDMYVQTQELQKGEAQVMGLSLGTDWERGCTACGKFLVKKGLLGSPFTCEFGAGIWLKGEAHFQGKQLCTA